MSDWYTMFYRDSCVIHTVYCNKNFCVYHFPSIKFPSCLRGSHKVLLFIHSNVMEIYISRSRHSHFILSLKRYWLANICWSLVFVCSLTYFLRHNIGLNYYAKSNQFYVFECVSCIGSSEIFGWFKTFIDIYL